MHKPTYTQPSILLWNTVECLLDPDKDSLKFEILRSPLDNMNHTLFPVSSDWSDRLRGMRPCPNRKWCTWLTVNNENIILISNYSVLTRLQN